MPDHRQAFRLLQETHSCFHCGRAVIVEFSLDTHYQKHRIKPACPHCGSTTAIELARPAGVFAVRRPADPPSPLAPLPRLSKPSSFA